MIRYFLTAAAAALVLATPVEAKRIIAEFTPLQKLLSAEVVVVGKVTAIEKDTVDVEPFPGAKDKQTYKVAVIKIETDLIGAANITHVRVGFVLPPPPNPGAPPVRPASERGFAPVFLAEGQTGLFYLTKHHSG